jgi:hypothetical protein
MKYEGNFLLVCFSTNTKNYDDDEGKLEYNSVYVVSIQYEKKKHSENVIVNICVPCYSVPTLCSKI